MAKWRVQLLGITSVEALKRNYKEVPIIKTWEEIEAATLYEAKKKAFGELRDSKFGEEFARRNNRELEITDVLPFLKARNHIDRRESPIKKPEARKKVAQLLKRQKVLV